MGFLYIFFCTANIRQRLEEFLRAVLRADGPRWRRVEKRVDANHQGAGLMARDPVTLRGKCF